MAWESRYICYLRSHFHKQNITNAIYLITFFYLILFSILYTLYGEQGVHQEVAQRETYRIDNVVVNLVDCYFPVSGQYQKTSRCICYLLLIFTIIVRSHGWLAVGAAASVLTYSGVAAIHSVVLFATNNMFHLQSGKSRCEPLPVPGPDAPFLACAGIEDPDIFIIMHIVSSVMLGALPMAAWSTTFRKSASKAILIFWLLLLALGHLFNPLTIVDENFHFQICPKDHVEPLPRFNFQAPLLDAAWSHSFASIVSASHQASPSIKNSSVPACLYSCFATSGYVGRNVQDGIVTTPDGPNPFVKNESEARNALIIFWWAYTLLALLTFFTTEKQDRLPRWVHKQVYRFEYCQKSWATIWMYTNKCKYNTDVMNNGLGRDVGTTSANTLVVTKPYPIKYFHITVLQLVQFFLQLSSLAACVGTILSTEIIEAAEGQTPHLEQEQFATVGQWGCVAVVILVLFAAVVGRFWGGESEHFAVDEMKSWEKEIERDNKTQVGTEDWHWRVGYTW